jgi:hypothetical protein
MLLPTFPLTARLAAILPTRCCLAQLCIVHTLCPPCGSEIGFTAQPSGASRSAAQQLLLAMSQHQKYVTTFLNRQGGWARYQRAAGARHQSGGAARGKLSAGRLEPGMALGAKAGEPHAGALPSRVSDSTQ